MAWSSAFLDGIGAQSRSMIWLVELLEVSNSPRAGSLVLSSDSRYGDAPILGMRGVRVQGQRLSPASASSTIGAFDIDVVGDPSVIFEHLTRGTVLRVLAGFSGWQTNDFQPVAFGAVWNIRRSGEAPVWTIECRDATTILRTRMSMATATAPLFYGVGSTTTIATAAYVIADATLTVTASAAFSRETAGTGALAVTPDTGDAFILLWSSVAANVFTLSGAASEHFATTRSAAAIGNTVTEVAYLSGHPLNLLRRVLTSTGAGTNGSYDSYPIDWGLAIPYALIDDEDINAWRDQVVVAASGAYTWEVPVFAPVDDALSWMQGIMAPSGFFFAMRQGRLTIRAIRAQGTTAYTLQSGITITDTNVVRVLEWEGYASDSGIEYAGVTGTCIDHGGTTRTSNVTENPATLPAVANLDADLTGVYYGTNYAVVLAEAVGRVREAATRIPEVLTVDLTLWFAQLCPGDAVLLKMRRAFGRLDRGGTYDNRAAIVLEVSPDWIAGACRVVLAIYPSSGDVFVP